MKGSRPGIQLIERSKGVSSMSSWQPMDFHTKYYYPTATWMREHSCAQSCTNKSTSSYISRSLFCLQDLLSCDSCLIALIASVIGIVDHFFSISLLFPVSKESVMQWMVNWPSFSSVETGAGVQGGNFPVGLMVICDDQTLGEMS